MPNWLLQFSMSVATDRHDTDFAAAAATITDFFLKSANSPIKLSIDFRSNPLYTLNCPKPFILGALRLFFYGRDVSIVSRKGMPTARRSRCVLLAAFRRRQRRPLARSLHRLRRKRAHRALFSPRRSSAHRSDSAGAANCAAARLRNLARGQVCKSGPLSLFLVRCAIWRGCAVARFVAHNQRKQPSPRRRLCRLLCSAVSFPLLPPLPSAGTAALIVRAENLYFFAVFSARKPLFIELSPSLENWAAYSLSPQFSAGSHSR